MATVRKIKIAACAPATFGFVPEEAVAATERAIHGHETDPRRLMAHVDRMLDHHLRVLAEAARVHPDLAVIPEDVLRLGMTLAQHGGEAWCSRFIVEAYERTLERLGQFCRQHHVSVAGATVTRRRGRYYNTAILQDPVGRVIATYDKTHLPRDPKGDESGFLTAGNDLPVFDTALGRIGFLICWDIIFPETFAVLALRGAELVIQPTFGHAGEWCDVTARSRCQDWSVPLAVSMWGRNACIVDPAGRMAAHSGPEPNAVAVATLTLGAPRRHVYLTDAARQLRAERRPELYRILTTRPREGGRRRTKG